MSSVREDLLVDICTHAHTHTHTHTHTCRYCEARRKVVLDHVYEGYDQDFWEYMQN